ncbi:hypothetical protein GIB67_006180 [Kingdonia uniflora]|uniref:Vacuolar iron transporter n=1 Tax=Kingdonia uniflora TaxID=39325 RepID=A0A7J7LQ69_9MAGN|nr:hypothetical protein GIB67_006180 [Kingdonia uniflora]
MHANMQVRAWIRETRIRESLAECAHNRGGLHCWRTGSFYPLHYIVGGLAYLAIVATRAMEKLYNVWHEVSSPNDSPIDRCTYKDDKIVISRTPKAGLATPYTTLCSDNEMLEIDESLGKFSEMAREDVGSTEVTQKLLNNHLEPHFTSKEVVRDIIIGVSDGLTVPFALAAGLSGAKVASSIILTAGLAEVAAGAISMGLGG